LQKQRPSKIKDVLPRLALGKMSGAGRFFPLVIQTEHPFDLVRWL
jgi:hypothetical protein